jgi:hypothetical protein
MKATRAGRARVPILDCIFFDLKGELLSVCFRLPTARIAVEILCRKRTIPPTLALVITREHPTPCEYWRERIGS